jgi:hypothetical protein
MTDRLMNIDPDQLIDPVVLAQLIDPSIAEQPGFFITNTNNVFLLATRLFKTLTANPDATLSMCSYTNPGFAPDCFHGLFNYDFIYYVDLAKVKYSAYTTFIKLLDMLIRANRIDGVKLVFILANIQLVLQQYLAKFIYYTETWSHTATLLFIGSGYRATSLYRQTKLKGLCAIYRVIYRPLLLPNSKFSDEAARQVHYLLDGDVVKSLMLLERVPWGADLSSPGVLHIPRLLLKSPNWDLSVAMPLTLESMLAKLPVYRLIYQLYLTPSMDICYKLLGFPGYTPSRIMSAMVRILSLAKSPDIQDIIKLAASLEGGCQPVEEPIITMLAFIAGLIKYKTLNKYGCQQDKKAKAQSKTTAKNT